MLYNTQNHWLSGLFTSAEILNTRMKRLGTLIYFRPHVKGRRHLLCWVPQKDEVSIIGQPISHNSSTLRLGYSETPLLTKSATRHIGSVTSVFKNSQ
jgi:hypothetical protein